MRRILRPFPWALLGHLCLGIVLAPLMVAVLTAAVAAAPLAVVSPYPFLVLTRIFVALADADRVRFQVLQGVEVGGRLQLPAGGLPGVARVTHVISDPEFGRVAVYALVRLGLALLGVVAVTVVLTVPLLRLTALFSTLLLPGYYPTGVTTTPFGPVPAGLFWGAIVLFGAPVVIRGAARLDAQVTSRLLGVDSEELERRVGELVAARDRTVSAADAERAKLERDLHDGAQQRLIALSVLLGQAEAKLSGGAASDDAALTLVRRARSETSGTIDELRTLTRGLRPPILEARGLDAALSAVAARLPMPVTLRVTLVERPDPALEAMLYFAVTEALTNVAKHGAGAPASVRVERTGSLLRATVRDAGPGGAQVAEGTGLRGIADRLSVVDGRLFLSSPPGGPTILTVEVPCA